MSPGDEAALCRELVPRVRAFALRRTGNAALAADVAQEVAVLVIEALREGRVEDPSRLSSFVLGVARNVLMALRRGERRRSELIERFGSALEPETRVEDHGVDRAKVDDCFAKLAPRARAVVALTFYADRSAEEIARELGVEPGNVRVIRHRALAQLHACMGGGS
jgi:RNA polymerase sigma-70 factor (ECF subfamily)